jgi:hypothetical protein
LRDQLTRQARGILDDDDPNAVAFDAVEQVCKADRCRMPGRRVKGEASPAFRGP